jgi:hypothetical protein
MPAEPADSACQVRVAVTMNRRRAEALALALRQRLKQLGIDGAKITIAPSRGDIDAPAEDTKRQPAAPSV